MLRQAKSADASTVQYEQYTLVAVGLFAPLKSNSAVVRAHFKLTVQAAGDKESLANLKLDGHG